MNAIFSLTNPEHDLVQILVRLWGNKWQGENFGMPLVHSVNRSPRMGGFLPCWAACWLPCDLYEVMATVVGISEWPGNDGWE